MYKSSDAGKTWTHLGLRYGQQIPQIPPSIHEIPNRLFVAVLGHPTAQRRTRHLPIYRRWADLPEGSI